MKTQAPVPKPAQNVATTPNEGEDDDGASKKRKRSSGKSQTKEVNKNNLADMWERVIEGVPKKKKPKVEKPKVQEVIEDEPVADDIKTSPTEELGGDVVQDTISEERVKKGKTKKEKKKEKKTREEAAVESGDAAKGPTKETPSKAPVKPAPPPAMKLTPLQASMRQKLISARFRHLNQTLYTTPSAHSLSLFKENPEMFNEYHEGFRRQVEVWPENPVDGYIRSINERGKIRGPSRGKPVKKEEGDIQPLPRTEGRCNIADLGCGDAAISTALQPSLKKLHLKIHSFDLHSPSSLVTKADIASLPIPDNSIDVAIFCLALMGTNWIDFIEEAFRILRWKGELWIAEIKSRFGRVGGGGSRVVEHSVGNRKKNNVVESKEAKKANKRKDEEDDDAVAAVEVDGVTKPEETDVSAFVEVLRKRGFVLKGEGKAGGAGEGIDLRNKMFVKLAFVKGITPIKGKGVPVPKGMEEITGEKSWQKKEKKFLEGKDEGSEMGSEAKVLKPCVYKLR